MDVIEALEEIIDWFEGDACKEDLPMIKAIGELVDLWLNFKEKRNG